jgi:hypothetical protein
MKTIPIEFDKQDPGHGSYGPLEWAAMYAPKRDYTIFSGKKLSPAKPTVHASHGNCFSRGYTEILGKSVVSPWPSSIKRNNELLYYKSRPARSIRGGHAKTE